MVFFSCDGCGEMLKKAQVDAHVYKCRKGCESVSCVDCSVAFYGDDYREHTVCITEAERYEKSVYRGPKKKAQKASPQQLWMDLIASASDSAPRSIQSHLSQLAFLGNVPRKEKQFRNFASNSLRLGGGRNSSVIVDEIWKYLSILRQKNTPATNTSQPGESQQETRQNAGEAATKEFNHNTQDEKQAVSHSDATTKQTKSSNNSLDESITEEKLSAVTACNGGDGGPLSPKIVSKAMKKILKKAPKCALKVKKLRRAVQEKLLLKKESKDLKRMILDQIEENKKIRMEGKMVVLTV